VVQASESTSARPGYRERHRAARRREFLDIARRVLSEEGEQALTMQRLTDEVGSSAGGIYVYFASRDALIEDLQCEAFTLLLESYERGRVDLDAYLADQDLEPAELAAVGLLANCAFWIDSEVTLPVEITICRHLIAQGTVARSGGEERLLAPAFGLLDEGRRRLDAATAAGVIGTGDNAARALMLIASATGVLLVSSLASLDASLFDGRRLATALTTDVLLGWSAPPDLLDRAREVLDGFRATASVAPFVPAT